MKAVVSPIRPSERGALVANLQQALLSLNFSIATDEMTADFFGESTLAALRRFQESFHVPMTGIVDEATAKTLNDVLKNKQLLDKAFKVSGRVFDAFGQPMVKATVHVFDVDLRGVPLVRKVSNVRETMQIVGFQWIGSTATNTEGYYEMAFDTENFINGDKSHADIVSFLTVEDKIIERSRLATKRDYVGNEIQNWDIRAAADVLLRGKSEFDTVVEAINPIFQNSGIDLNTTALDAEQIAFLAQETDIDAAKLTILFQAITLMVQSSTPIDTATVSRNRLSASDFELLYALGRENVGLTFAEITSFATDTLLSKIKTAIDKNTINAKTDEIIKIFLERLMPLSTAQTLRNDATTPIPVRQFNNLLNLSLKTPTAKNSFLTIQKQIAPNADPQKFWKETLPQAGLNTQEINALKLTNQLHLLTNGNATLVELLQSRPNMSSPTQLMNLSQVEWVEVVKKAGLPENMVHSDASGTEGGTIEEKLNNYIGTIQNTLNAAYPTQKIAAMVQKGELQTQNLANSLTAFFSRATDFDFATKRIEDFEPLIQAVAPQEATAVRQSLQTMQRVFQISPTPQAMSALMSNGITSAFQVASVPEAAFVQTYAKALGGEQMAMAVHSRAHFAVAKATDTLMSTYELTHGITPAAVNMGIKTDAATTNERNLSIQSDVMDTVKKHIPNYENIFGRADICECRDCRSINSPAAYLVDVMRFLSKLPANTAAQTPLQVLSHRRPDLAFLPLTCENTNTVIPYIDLVNEILEYYVAKDKLDKDAAHDTGNATAQELRATPQYRVAEAYKKLANAVYPTQLPYHMPLDTLRSFMPDGVKRGDLMAKLNQKGMPVVAEQLELSEKEYAILTRENFDNTPEATPLWAFYGFDTETNLNALIPQVNMVLERTGINYVDLVALVKTRFLNPAQEAFDYIQDLFKDSLTATTSGFNGQMLYAGLRMIHSDPANADMMIDVDGNFKTVLVQKGITNAEFIAWVETHFEGIRQLVTLHEPNSSCQLETTSLRTLAHIYEAVSTTSLSDDFLSKLHRFIRLWRKTGWSIEALDSVLTALKATDLTPSVLADISTLKTLADKTKLPLDRLATLWGTIETLGEKSLYSRLFLNRAVSKMGTVFQADKLGNYLTDNTATIGAHLSAILAAFKIKKEDFDLLAKDGGMGENTVLNLENLSNLYRYVVLSKALKLNSSDFILIKNLFAINPFTSPDTTLDFSNLSEKIKASGFSAKELNYLFTGNDGNLVAAKIPQTLATIQTSLKKIAEENPTIPENEQLTLRKNTVIENIAALVGLNDLQVAEVLRGDVLANLLVPATFESTVKSLHRGASVIKKGNLSNEEVKHFIDHSAALGNLDFKNLTVAHWHTLNDFATLKRNAPEADWVLIFETAYTAATTLDDVLAVATFETNWGLDNLTEIASIFGFNKSHLQKPDNWIIVAQAALIASESGISAKRLAEWAKPETDFDKLDTLAQDIQNAVRAKYDDKEWTEFAPTVNNPLRERRRDALVSYLLLQPDLKNWGVTDANSLYEYFLIDVQMGACMDTSRVRQAMSSVQLFVTRCLLNLERQKPTNGAFWVSPEQIKTLEWEWMKLYRVWEANRKVYIHPENWLEPEWRDDRSPFFKELEAELTQNDISTLTVETAFRNYLKKLQDVSHLDIVGVYKEGEKIHVVARSYGATSQFYYRHRNEYGRWSAWENLGLDIKTVGEGDKNGVHVLPMRWKGRLFLFWLEFSEISKPEANDSSEKLEAASKSKSPNDLKGKKAWRTFLAWSEYRDGKWLPKQMSKIFIETKSFTNPAYSRVAIRVRDNKLIVQPPAIGESRIDPKKLDRVSTVSFILTDVEAEIKTDYVEMVGDLKRLYFGSILNYYDGIAYENKDAHFMKSSRTGTMILNKKDYLKAQRKHYLAFNNQLLPSDFEIDVPSPFFYQDGERSFFVQPKSGRYVYDVVKTPERVPYGPYLELASGLAIKSAVQLVGVNRSIGNLDAPQTTATERGVTAAGSINALNTEGGAKMMDYIAASQNVGASSMVLSSKKGTSASAALTRELSASFAGASVLEVGLASLFRWETSLKFENFYHPYTDKFLERLNHGGIPELMSSDTFLSDDKGATFNTVYQPVANLVDSNYPSVKVEFDENSAYGIYNWELFFHAPLYIATRLSKNGKYAEAMQWYHYIFNPMTAETPDADNKHFWQVPPFKISAKENIEQFFTRLANKEASQAEINKIKEWRENPFKPHLIARGRPTAFMKNVVMKYVENLIAWGDDLFRRDTMESTNEATQLYVIAAHILGPKPQFIPKRGTVKAETFDSLQGKLDDFGNALVQMENLFPYSSSVPMGNMPPNPSLLGVGTALYFCIPNNANLLKYWETVGDRLFKLRHCMNIDGVERKLALFDPPIDPSVLIAATAKGLSLGSVLSDLFSPSPMYRFKFLLDKSIDLCSEVRTFGGQLLRVLEKKDAAALEVLRSTHETGILKMVEDVKAWQVIEARNQKETLLKTREKALTDLNYNLKLMAIKSGSEGVDVPAPPQLNTAKKPKKDDELARDIVINGIGAIASGSEDAVIDAAESSLKLIAKEKFDLDVDEVVKDIKLAISAGEAIGKVLSMIPQFDIAAKPFGVGAGTALGGVQLSKASEFFTKVQDIVAIVKQLEGKKAAQTAQHIRREQNWVQNAKVAVADIYQIDRQIVISDIRIAMAEKELSIHQEAIKNVEAVEDFLKTKFTNGNLYQFMKERLFAVYKQSYQLAYDMAKTAEKAYRQELGISTSNFVQYGYFDSTMQGLTAGEQLHVALRQMEKAYLEANKRAFEITKQVSLANTNPKLPAITQQNRAALAQLKNTGVAEFELPEAIFDMDYAGHYFRRIKSVSISIVAPVEGTTAVAATLRLLKNSVRINTSGGSYERNNEGGIPIDDERFVENNVPFKAIATSHGKRDTGVFELDFNDARYLPFEGAGAISRWKLEMPKKAFQPFDYTTITDVVLHVNYTAREDVGQFKTRAETALTGLLNP